MDRRILLVEDEPTLQRILGSVLSDAGHVVESVGTAEAAVQRLKQTERERIDLVLSDKNLPGISGLDLLTHLREQDRVEGVERAFVLVTGYPSRDSAMTIIENGGNGYLVKPFRSLIKAVETVTQIMEAPLSDFRVATDIAQSAVATLRSDDNPAFLSGTRVTVLLDDDNHRKNVIKRSQDRGATVVELSALAEGQSQTARLLIAGRAEDLAEYARTAPKTALILADAGASFRALQSLIHSGGAGVIDPDLLGGGS